MSLRPDLALLKRRARTVLDDIGSAERVYDGGEHMIELFEHQERQIADLARRVHVLEQRPKRGPYKKRKKPNSG